MGSIFHHLCPKIQLGLLPPLPLRNIRLWETFTVTISVDLAHIRAIVCNIWQEWYKKNETGETVVCNVVMEFGRQEYKENCQSRPGSPCACFHIHAAGQKQ